MNDPEPTSTLAASLREVFADLPPTSLEAWRERVVADLKGAPFERLVTRLEEGIPFGPLYTADAARPPAEIGVPGAAPFTRGAAPLGAAASGWDARQVHDQVDPTSLSAALAADLAGGVTSIALTFDRSVRLGLDAPVGDGLVARTVDELDRALSDVDLAATPLGLDAGAATAAVAAQLVALADRRGVARASLRLDLGADPLGALARDGALPLSLDAALVELGALARFCAAELPRARAVGVDAGPYHDAGCTAVQELAWSLATGLAYLRALTAAGLDPRAAAGQITFTLRVGCRFLVDVAKLRAARRLWARVLEVVGVDDVPIRLGARTADRVLTRRDPWTNLLRVTVATFAAATGGAEVIVAAPFDRALGPPDDDARRLARNTQRVLADEAHLHRVVDPGGGSHAVEHLTASLAEAAWAELQRVEALGGLAVALTSGDLARAATAAADARAAAIARRKTPITGVSEFPHLGEAPVLRPPEDLSQLAPPRPPADPARRDVALARVPSGGLDALVAAAAAGARVAEVVSAQAGDRSGGVRITRLAPRRDAEPFEGLRDRSDAHLAATGARPQVFLATLGAVADHLARANWIKALFEAGGFASVGGAPYSDARAVAAAWREHDAALAVVCASDAVYAERAAAAVAALRDAGAPRILLAGRPGDLEAPLREAGAAGFVFMGQDLLAVLTAELDAAEVAR